MTTGGADRVFVDSNVLVYASVVAAPFYQQALQALRRLGDSGAEMWISRQVIREYLATLSRPQTFANPQPAALLARVVRYFEGRFHVAEDNSAVTARLLALIQQVPVGGKQIHDANIVATMQAHGISRLLTHNMADFNRFSGLIIVVPL